MKLEKIEEAIAKTGNAYKKLTIDGKAYNFFDVFPQGLNVGDDVTCEFQKKGEYTNLVKLEKASDEPKEQIAGTIIRNMPSVTRHDVIIEQKAKPHSYEFGKAGARHKVYYDTVADLKATMQELKEAGLLDDEPEFPMEQH